MTPVRLLLILVASIFAIEMLVMFALAVLQPSQQWQITLLDAIALTVLLFPVLYFLVFRPLKARDVREEFARQKLEQMEGFQRLNRILISRELRMKELYAENQALKVPSKERKKTDAEGKVDYSLVAGVEAAEPITEGQEHDALIFALEDLERSQKQIEQAHHEWVAAMDALKDPVFMHDRDGRIMRANRAYAERAGMSVKDVIGKLYWDAFPKQGGPLPYCLQSIQEIERGEEGREGEEEVQLVGGEVFISRSFLVRDRGGSYLYSLHVMEDVTERKLAAEALQHERDFATGIVETAQAIILVLDTEGRIVRFNHYMETLSGYTLAEVQGRDWVSTCLPERDHEQIRAFFHDISSGTLIREHVNPILTRDGKERKIEWHNKALMNATGNIVGVLSTGHDITERERSEQALQHANRAFRTLSACNHELVHATDEQQLLQAMCHVIVEDGGYSAAWVGYKQQDAEQTVRPMAECGFEPGFVDTMQITWSDSERGQGPTSKAMRSGMTQITQDVASDPCCAPWREQALRHGYASGIALPLHNDGEVFDTLNIYAAEVNAFDPKEIALLEEMADNLAFGIRMLRLRQEQQRNATQVREGLEGTIQAIAGMVEMRDPYTAGHQQRVAQLAAAIATEMGLPEEQVHGIHLAGTIHDLGKIQTPAEILSKPGKLNAIEYDLIKEHAQNGYEILKDIEFPWPVAQIAWQHHERLDGSGYPQGLKGDEILLEARILSVADVTEAIMSHRPYRPGLGLEIALNEITKGRGVHYDSDVVDICVRLFRENRFKFNHRL